MNADKDFWYGRACWYARNYSEAKDDNQRDRIAVQVRDDDRRVIEHLLQAFKPQSEEYFKE